MTTIRPFDYRRLPGADGATIAVADWPGKRGPLVCVHGLTSSSHAFAGLATELPEYRVIAVDCRGRGNSSADAPFGILHHVADLASVMDAAAIDHATLVGHSMGAYIIGAFAAEHPRRVERLVFVDGGYFLEYPAELTPEILLDNVLAPFLEKLHRTWTSFDEYIAYYESTALYPDGVDDYGRAHFGNDLTGDPPNLRSKVNEACILPDWKDVLDHAAVSKRLQRIDTPLLLLRAPRGLTGSGDEVIPDAVRDQIIGFVPHSRVVDVPDTNHHTILCSQPGARVVAHAIDEFVG